MVMLVPIMFLAFQFIDNFLQGLSLFGSYSTVSDNEYSDIDFKIEQGALRSLFQISSFRLAVEDALSILVDIVISESSDKDILKAIQKDKVLLYRDAEQDYLAKIIGYCHRIDSNLKRFNCDYPTFETNHLFQDARCICVVQIGELVGQLSDEVKESSPSIPWRTIKDTRNFYVHAYGSIDLPSV